MSSDMANNIYSVDFKRTKLINSGSVPAIVLRFRVAETTPRMQRPSVYTYTVTDPPGVNVYRLRQAYGWSMRDLGEKCHPSIEHTTIRRLENNLGFTQDTLERVAKALRVKVYELFLPPELAEWPSLSREAQVRLAESVQDAAVAARYKSKKVK